MFKEIPQRINRQGNKKISWIANMVLALAGVLCLAATGCELDLAPPGADIIAIGVENNGETIDVPVGGTLELTLDSNPTTGYAWHTTQSPDQSLLQVSEEFISSPESALYTGAGGQSRWTMKALKAGTTTLELVYKRDGSKAAGTSSYKITIRIK